MKGEESMCATMATSKAALTRRADDGMADQTACRYSALENLVHDDICETKCNLRRKWRTMKSDVRLHQICL